MKSILFLSFFLVLKINAQELEPHRYSMGELELMAKNKDWAKVILFIKDIPKSDQDLQWKNLLERAAIGYLSSLKKHGGSDAEQMAQELIFEFPTLGESAKYENLKNEIIFDGYRSCFLKKVDLAKCLESALELMGRKNSSPNLRQLIGGLVLNYHKDSLSELCKVFDSFKESKGFFEKNCNTSKNIQKNN